VVRFKKTDDVEVHIDGMGYPLDLRLVGVAAGVPRPL